MTVTTTSDAGPGLRERKKAETRFRLRSVALRLAVERGVEHVTVEDIASEADVSPRTFFNYFNSKEEALIGPDPTSAAELAQALADRPAGEPPLESLRQLVLMRAAHIEEHVDEVRARMHLINSSPALQPAYLATTFAFDRILTEGIAARLGTDPVADPYPALLVAVGSTAMRATVASWLMSSGQRHVADLINDAFDQISAGLPAPQTTHAQSQTATKRTSP
jgi:AcrR family transcriptional regulator